MSKVIRQVAATDHYLAVFDKHTGRTLYLGRTRRIASTEQRIVLYAKDRGCTLPGCAAPGYHCEVHHSTPTGPTTDNHVDDVPWPAAGTTASSKPAAGGPENAKTAAPNGSLHHTWTQARPA